MTSADFSVRKMLMRCLSRYTAFLVRMAGANSFDGIGRSIYGL